MVLLLRQFKPPSSPSSPVLPPNANQTTGCPRGVAGVIQNAPLAKLSSTSVHVSRSLPPVASAKSVCGRCAGVSWGPAHEKVATPSHQMALENTLGIKGQSALPWPANRKPAPVLAYSR